MKESSARAMSLAIVSCLWIACGSEARSPDGDLDAVHIALYIGIDDYEHHKDLRGCVNDMENLRKVLHDSYAFTLEKFIKNKAATRKGIAGALRWLADQTERAARAGRKVTVVLAYSGHGNLITAVDPQGEGGEKDETWVPHESDRYAASDIRDDDIGKVLTFLQKHADVVFYTDACHSGSSFRSAGSAATRSVREPGDPIVQVKYKTLFPEPRFNARNRNPRLVHYAACHKSQVAREDRPLLGRARGRFSYSFLKVLRANRGATTYDELFRRVCVQFAQDWDGDSQQPQMNLSGEMAGRTCFGRKPAPDHAPIMGDQEGDRVTVAMGNLHGVSEGARFDFYATLDDVADSKPLRLGGKPVWGTVKSVDAGTSVVELERSDRLPETAVATLASVNLEDFRVRVAGSLPAGVQAELRKLFAEKRCGEARAGEPFDLELHHDAANERILFYRATQLPPDGKPLLRFYYADPDADLADTVVKLAGRRRLLHLTRNEAFVRVSVTGHEGGKGRALPAEQRIQQFETGSDGKVDIDLVIENRYRDDAWVFVFLYEEEKNPKGERPPPLFEVLHPKDANDKTRYLIHGRDRRTIPKWIRPEWGTQSRIRIKILLTSREYPWGQFKHLEGKFKLGAPRGPGDALVQLIEDAVRGGSRGGGNNAVATFWATGSVVFDVRQKSG